MQADLASLKDSQKVIDQTMERFGRVDILVNNAAVFAPSLFVGVSEKVWDETIDTDLKGAFFLAQFAAKAMISGGRAGRIISYCPPTRCGPQGSCRPTARPSSGCG